MTERNEDQHYDVNINISGNDKVSFVTGLGWSSRSSINIDACNIKDAVSVATKYLSGLELAPAFNDCNNEVYIERAQHCIDSVKNMLLTIEGATNGIDEGDVVYVNIDSTLDIFVGFTKTYTVVFGEKSEA